MPRVRGIDIIITKMWSRTSTSLRSCLSNSYECKTFIHIWCRLTSVGPNMRRSSVFLFWCDTFTYFRSQGGSSQISACNVWILLSSIYPWQVGWVFNFDPKRVVLNQNVNPKHGAFIFRNYINTSCNYKEHHEKY